MHILATLLAWPPTTIGGPIASSELLKELCARGHTVTAMTKHEDRRNLDLDEFGMLSRMDSGVRVISSRGWARSLKSRIDNVDIVYTHPDLANNQLIRPLGWDVARSFNVPLVYTLHNVRRGTHVSARVWQPSMYIWNSPSTRQFSEIADTIPGVVSPPILRVSDHYTDRDGPNSSHVTLVNVSEDKGAMTFFALAERLPDVQFIGVRGGTNRQLTTTLPNVEIIGPFDRKDMPREVWSKTHVLLMPSKIEAWGMSAIEAACSGIPTIASPTTGLVDALGDAGTFADVNDIDSWEKELVALLSSDTDYKLRSADAYLRALDVERMSLHSVVDVENMMVDVGKNGALPSRKVSERGWSPRHSTMIEARDVMKPVRSE